MSKVLAHDVHLELANHESVVLKAGSSVPKEYADRVTNPRAFVEVEAEPVTVTAPTPAPTSAAAAAETTPAAEKPDYLKMRKPEITALATSRGVDASGSIKVIADRLAAKDEEEAAAKAAAEASTEVDLTTLDEPALRAYAAEHKVDLADASSTEEIIALIENAQGE